MNACVMVAHSAQHQFDRGWICPSCGALGPCKQYCEKCSHWGDMIQESPCPFPHVVD